MLGTIFDIQRFCINDGPGIRTTVFFKGCPLKCLWCHNPESQSPEREIMFYKEKCTACGKCVGSTFDELACPNEAKVVCGKTVSSSDVVDIALKDEPFYNNSDGGVTLSGGEPFYQFDFMLELLKELKSHDLHTAVETSGATSRENIEKASQYIDLFLFDYKETNSDKHRLFTGVGNDLILQNLECLNVLKKPAVLRCPIVIGCNDREEHFCGIADIANKYDNVLHVEIEPYHNLGEAKRTAIGMSEQRFETATDDVKKAYLEAIREHTEKIVKFA